MSTRRSPRREQGSQEHLSPQAPGRLHGEGEGRRAQPQVSTRVGVQRLVTAAPLPSSPLPRALNSLGGDDDTGMPIRAWGDESHADVLPKLCVVTPASDGTQGGAEGQQGAHGRTRSIGNSRQFLRHSSGWSWRQLPTTGGSTQEPRVSEAGPQLLPEHWRDCRWLCHPGSGSALRRPAATPQQSGVHGAQLRRWIGREPLTLSGVRELAPPGHSARKALGPPLLLQSPGSLRAGSACRPHVPA